MVVLLRHDPAAAEHLLALLGPAPAAVPPVDMRPRPAGAEAGECEGLPALLRLLRRLTDRRCLSCALVFAGKAVFVSAMRGPHYEVY